mmetsp:Transcript_12608/g.18747  ORF Transcript_12608/g.18747 Transcript_12608/m.18747 type:complete len:130 (-) Transcript_12608:49-438(-)
MQPRQEKNTVINFSETRMNNAHDHIEASLKMLNFVRGIRNNAEFVAYYNEPCRTNAAKMKLDDTINGCNGEREMQMQTILPLTAIFKRVHLLCSRQDTPVSALIFIFTTQEDMMDKIQDSLGNTFLTNG